MIKKLLFKVCFMMAALFAVLMVMPGPGGEPVMSVEDLPGYGLVKAASNAADYAEQALEAQTPEQQIYTWVDENGAVHYSHQAAPGATAHEISQSNPPIPSEKFVGEIDFKKRSQASSSGGGVFKTGSSRGVDQGLSADDFQALAEGDLSNASKVLKELPAYLQEAHQKREEALKDL